MRHEWMRESILKGLQGLLVLRLDGSPAADTVPALANAWLAILGKLNRIWDEERDKRRLSMAFLAIATYSDSWPSPNQFIKSIPPVDEPVKLAAPTSKNMPPEIRDALNKFLSKSKPLETKT